MQKAIVTLILLLASPLVGALDTKIVVEEFPQQQGEILIAPALGNGSWGCESVIRFTPDHYCQELNPPNCLLNPNKEAICSEPTGESVESLVGIVYHIDPSTKFVMVGIIPNPFELFVELVVIPIFLFFCFLGLIARCCDPTF